MAAGYAVIYLEGQPYPLTAAGDAGDGRLFYMEGQKPHFVREDLLVVANDLSVALYDGNAMAYYFTPAAECFEMPLRDTIQIIENLRQNALPGEIAATIRQLDPAELKP